MKKIKVGVIGTGSLANYHINGYRSNQNVEITALCDSNGDRARKKAMELNIAEYYNDYNEMLRSENIDAVSVITWNNTHAPITIAALNAGKHVLCEKPPALNAAQAIEMQEAAKKADKLLMFGFVRRFAQNTQVVKEFVNSGELGKVYYAKTGCLRRCGSPGGWFANREISGGGCLIDLGVHIIDLSMYLMGKPKPVSVFGNINSSVGYRANIKGISWYKSVDYGSTINEVEDFANTIIKFDNGACLYVETSWAMNIKSDTLYLELFGDKGGARLEPELEIFGEKNDYLIDFKPILDSATFDFDRTFAAEINHFVDCILYGTPCLCPSEDGVTIMKILDAVYESSKTGDIVKLS